MKHLKVFSYLVIIFAFSSMVFASNAYIDDIIIEVNDHPDTGDGEINIAVDADTPSDSQCENITTEIDILGLNFCERSKDDDEWTVCGTDFHARNYKFNYTRESDIDNHLGLFASKSISVSGNALLESYNSENGDYSGENVFSKCNLYSNDTVKLNDSVSLYGDIYAHSIDINGNITHQGTQNITEKVWDGEKEHIQEMLQTVMEFNNNSLIGLTSDGNSPFIGDSLNFKLKANDSITLTKGVYYFESFEMSGSSNLNIDDNVIIFVNKKIKFSGNSEVNFGGSTKSLTFYSYSDNIELKGSTYVEAELFAVNNSIKISGNSEFFGKCFADEIEIKGNAKVHFNEYNADYFMAFSVTKIFDNQNNLVVGKINLIPIKIISNIEKDYSLWVSDEAQQLTYHGEFFKCNNSEGQWQSMFNAFEWLLYANANKDGLDTWNVIWRKSNIVDDYWNLSGKNRIEFWINHNQDFYSSSGEGEYLHIYLVCSTTVNKNDPNYYATKSIIGYKATIPLDFTDYWKKVTIYFDKTSCDDDYSCFTEVNNPPSDGYSQIKELRIYRTSQQNFDKPITIWITRINAYSEWLWNNNEGFFKGITIIPPELTPMYKAGYDGKWGKAFSLFQSVIKNRLNNHPYVNAPINNSIHNEVNDLYINYNYNSDSYHFRHEGNDNEGFKQKGDVDWKKIFKDYPNNDEGLNVNSHLNRHEPFLINTAEHYYFKQDTLIKQRCREFLNTFIDDADNTSIYPNGLQPKLEHWPHWEESSELIAWDGLIVGLRIQSWLRILNYEYGKSIPDIINRDIIDREILAGITKSLYNQAKWIYEVRTSEMNLYNLSNHECYAAASLYTFADVFPWFKDSNNFKEGAMSFLTQIGGKGMILNDGVNIEMDTHYQQLYQLAFNIVHENIKSFGDTSSNVFDQKYEKTRKWYRAITKPNFDDNSQIAYTPINGDGAYGLNYAQYNMIDLSDITYPSTCSAFDEAGQFVFRNGELSMGNDLFLFFDAGPYGAGAHQHQDKLTYDFYVRGNDWIVDPGGWGSKYPFFDQTYYHNIYFFGHHYCEVINNVLKCYDIEKIEQNRNKEDYAFDYEGDEYAPNFDINKYKATGKALYKSEKLNVKVTREISLDTLPSDKIVIKDTIEFMSQINQMILQSQIYDANLPFHLAPDVDIRYDRNDPSIIYLLKNKNEIKIDVSVNFHNNKSNNEHHFKKTSRGFIGTGNALLDNALVANYYIRKGDFSSDFDYSVVDVTIKIEPQSNSVNGSDQLNALVESVNNYLDNSEYNNLDDNFIQLASQYQEQFNIDNSSDQTLNLAVDLINMLHYLKCTDEIYQSAYNNMIDSLQWLDYNRFVKNDPFTTAETLSLIISRLDKIIFNNQSDKNNILLHLNNALSQFKSMKYNDAFSEIETIKGLINLKIVDLQLRDALYNLIFRFKNKLNEYLSYYNLINDLCNSLQYFIENSTSDSVKSAMPLIQELIQKAEAQDYNGCISKLNALINFKNSFSDFDKFPLLKERFEGHIENIESIIDKLH